MIGQKFGCRGKAIWLALLTLACPGLAASAPAISESDISCHPWQIKETAASPVTQSRLHSLSGRLEKTHNDPAIHDEFTGRLIPSISATCGDAVGILIWTCVPFVFVQMQGMMIDDFKDYRVQIHDGPVGVEDSEVPTSLVMAMVLNMSLSKMRIPLFKSYRNVKPLTHGCGYHYS